MTVIRPAVFDETVIAAVSTRTGGISPPPMGMNLSFNVGDSPENVEENRKRFFGGLSIGLDELAIPRQVHGAVVRKIDRPGTYESCDALFTDRRRVFLCVTIADCVPVLVHAPGVPAVGVVHAGWRGTANRILPAALGAMMQQFGCKADGLRMYLGPSAGVCCYDVGEEVASVIGEQHLRREGAAIRADLKSALLAQLGELGVPASNIEISPHCTISDSTLCHSYRRDRESSGRMMGVIGLR